MNIGTANDVITIQIQNSNIPFKYQVNLPRNTLVGLPKAFQRKTNWKYWIKYIKPIWCPQQTYTAPNILISRDYCFMCYVMRAIGDFTKYGQPVPHPDPTWRVGILHFQLWGWRYPSGAQTVSFSPHRYIIPIQWSNQLNQSERLIYAPLALITTDSGNALVSSLCQAIAWTNFDL